MSACQPEIPIGWVVARERVKIYRSLLGDPTYTSDSR